MLLNAEQILAAQDHKTKVVPVPEFGDGAEVLVGSMGALARAEMDDWIGTLGHKPEALETVEADEEDLVTCDDAPPADPPTAEDDEEEPETPKEYSRGEIWRVMIRWCAESILDPVTLKPTFGAAKVAELGGKSREALQRIYEAALEVNLATQPAAEAFEKNCDGTPDASSGGATP